MVDGEFVTIYSINAWEEKVQTDLSCGRLNFPSDIQNRDVGCKTDSIGRVMPGLSVKFVGPGMGKLILSVKREFCV